MPHKVLIVEDDPDSHNLLRIVLEPYGFTVRAAFDGVEALHILEEMWMPDLILTDLQMPRLDGIELLRQIKQQEQLNHVPVIEMTACDRSAERANEIGAALVLKKPLDIVELPSVISELIA